MKEYQHKSIQKIYDLFQEHNAELGKGVSITALMWKAIAPSIPEWLKLMDGDEELMGRIKTFLETIVEAMQEDADGNALNG